MRIGVLFGGRSPEHEVSLNSAASVLQSLDSTKYEIVPIAIDRSGTWRPGVTPQQLQAGFDAASGEIKGEAATLNLGSGKPGLIPVQAQPTSSTWKKSLDVLFPVMHGPYGEDGTIQGLLEMANIPYVGCDVLGSALCIDKEKTKLCLRGLGLPVLDSLTVERCRWVQDREWVLNLTEQRFSYPCFVKPNGQGSSIGISRVSNREQLGEAIDLAAQYDQKILVEPSVKNCREFSCAVLGNEAPEVSMVGELLAGNDHFTDYNEKYVNQQIHFEIPASLPAETSEMLRTQAFHAYQGLGLCGLARIDFFLDQECNQFYINEINTMPGFTSMSFYPKLWTSSGLEFPALLDRLITLALERYQERQQNRTKY